MIELDDAVDALTRPDIITVQQRDDNGAIIRVQSTQLEPLLRRLETAITPSGNSDAGSASLPNQRAVVDGDALHLHIDISKQISEWCHAWNIETSGDATVDLRRWHNSTPEQNNWDEAFYTRILRGWEHDITRLLEPPKTFQIPGACPVCGERSWYDGDEGGAFPVTVEYHVTIDGFVGDQRALCKACNTVWRGKEAVEELAAELAETGT